MVVPGTVETIEKVWTLERRRGCRGAVWLLACVLVCVVCCGMLWCFKVEVDTGSL